MRLPFAKYTGCGNDFILVDNRRHLWQLGKSPGVDRSEISRLCHRRFGIGADGVIFLETTPAQPYRMRIFNADGGEAEMCGNGVRCLAGFMRDSGIAGDAFDIHAMHHRVHARLHSSQDRRHLVGVTMPPPCDIAYGMLLPIEGENLTVHHLNTGVPHTVLFVEDLECPSLMELAPKIRFHPAFHPHGTNVNFVSLPDNNALYIRTYERGVEQETLACGTGAVAAAIASAAVHRRQSPISVHTRSTEVLHIDLNDGAWPIMTGAATHIFDGEILLDQRVPSLLFS